MSRKKAIRLIIEEWNDASTTDEITTLTGLFLIPADSQYSRASMLTWVREENGWLVTYNDNTTAK